MKLLSLFAAVFAALLFVGCGGAYRQRIQEKMDAYVGRQYAELQDEMGPPTRVSDDGRGGKILSWIREQETTYGSTYTPAQRRVEGRGFAAGFQRGMQSVQTNTSTTEVEGEYLDVWADQNGIIYRWKWRRQ